MVTDIRERRQQRAIDRYYFYLPKMIRKFNLLCGPQGVGKTAGGMWLADKIRQWIEQEEHYSPRVVVVSTSMGITDAFGPHYLLSIRDFICQLRGVNEVAKVIEQFNVVDYDQVEALMLAHRGCSDPAHDPNMIRYYSRWITTEEAEKLSEKQAMHLGEKGESCWTARNGVVLYRSVTLADEAYEFLGANISSNPVVRLAVNFIRKMRHFLLTFIVMTPHPREIATGARFQVKHTIWASAKKVTPFASTEEYVERIYLKVTEGLTLAPHTGRPPLCKFNFDPNRHIFNCYNSHEVVSFGGRSLNISDKYI